MTSRWAGWVSESFYHVTWHFRDRWRQRWKMISTYHPDFSEWPCESHFLGALPCCWWMKSHEDPEQNDFYLTIVQGGFLLEADFGTRKEGWFLGTLRVFFPYSKFYHHETMSLKLFGLTYPTLHKNFWDCSFEKSLLRLSKWQWFCGRIRWFPRLLRNSKQSFRPSTCDHKKIVPQWIWRASGQEEQQLKIESFVADPKAVGFFTKIRTWAVKKALSLEFTIYNFPGEGLCSDTFFVNFSSLLAGYDLPDSYRGSRHHQTTGEIHLK